jgi:methylenetetrahydrofolate reductase (NADPH)
MLAAIQGMNEQQTLLHGEAIEGNFAMCVGAVANPYLRPLELNIMKLVKKVEVGARFIQTQAVFDMDGFGAWLEAARQQGVTEKAAILAGVMPLASADEAEELCGRFTDFVIPDSIIERLKAAGHAEAQKKAGVAICVEIIQKLKALDGIKGIHILSGGKEAVVPELMAAAGL